MITKYKVPSSTSDKTYVVTMSQSSVTNCTCTGWKFRHKCKHADSVNENPKAFSKYKEGSEAVAPIVVGATGKFRKPMLAGSIDGSVDFSRRWVVEEKFDGHRMIVSVQHGRVIAWARSGKERTLPPHLQKAMAKFPTGVYDGELCIPHGRSYNVTETDRAHERAYVIFDVLEIVNRDVTDESYDRRREALSMIFVAAKNPVGVLLAESTPVRSMKEAEKLCGEIWDRDGEGIILKDRSARYEVGRRTKTFLKLKQLKTAVLTIIGFKAGRLGPHSRAIIKDTEGNETKVKIRNFKLIAEVEKNPTAYVGRKLRIDYQERTPDGSYRHPRWDRFENK